MQMRGKIRSLLALLLLSVALGSALRIAAAAGLPGETRTPAGVRERTSIYVTMRDGVEIAVDVWLPPAYRQGDRDPVLMRTTRYWRSVEYGWGLRLLAFLDLYKPESLVDAQRAYFNGRGFVVLKVDARGSGASGGRREVEFSPDEVADLGEVAAWAGRQVWSNGHVGTYGVSYDGNTAELAAVSAPLTVGAVMPLYDDFDVQALVRPGGVLLRAFVDTWGVAVAALDHDDVCAASEARGLDCWRARQITPGVKAVDADTGRRHLAALVGQHRTLDIAGSVGKAEFRDDALNAEGREFRFADISPYGMQRRIEDSKVPMMVWCGWMDAETCEGALIRYGTFSNPQEVVIGPLSHGGAFDADPFAASHLPPVPSAPQQYQMEADFFDRFLRRATAGAGAAMAATATRDGMESSIRFYTMGEAPERAWHTTRAWPPQGMQTERLYFAPDHALSATPSAEGSASGASRDADSYDVDFSASSGKTTRWHTQLGGADVIYPDRAAEDRKLLTYTGPPLTADLEITGHRLRLALAGADAGLFDRYPPTGPVTWTVHRSPTHLSFLELPVKPR
jgi:putative CocE/NonD family hydrolase